MRAVIGAAVAVVVLSLLSGCGGTSRDGATAETDSSEAPDVYFVCEDNGKESGGLEEVAVLDESGGDSPQAMSLGNYHNYSILTGSFRRHKFWTDKGRCYVLELSARRWNDDPDIYTSRSGKASPWRYHWKSTRPRHYPDVGGFVAGRSGWYYMAVKAYSGTGGTCRYRVRVFRGG